MGLTRVGLGTRRVRRPSYLHFHSRRPKQRAVFQLVGRRAELTFEPGDAHETESVLVAIRRSKSFETQALDRLFTPGIRADEALARGSRDEFDTDYHGNDHGQDLGIDAARAEDGDVTAAR